MSNPESSPEWVVSSSSAETNGQPLNNELIAVASRLWPRVQIHARRELTNWNPDDSVALATEVWEGVLQFGLKDSTKAKRKHCGDSGSGCLSVWSFPPSFQSSSETRTTQTGNDRAGSFGPGS